MEIRRELIRGQRRALHSDARADKIRIWGRTGARSVIVGAGGSAKHDPGAGIKSEVNALHSNAGELILNQFELAVNRDSR